MGMKVSDYQVIVSFDNGMSLDYAAYIQKVSNQSIVDCDMVNLIRYSFLASL